MPALRPRRGVLASTVLALAVAMSGCSDGSEEPSAAASSSGSASPSESGSSATPSASPTPSEPPAPKLPKAPAAKDTDAGRTAFAEFVIERWGYALLTNDATAVTELSPKDAPCQGCAELAAELKKRTKQGWYVDFPGARVAKVDVVPGEEPEVQVATATIDVPASQSYFEDGELRNENDARKGATFEVRMRLDGKRFVLLAFRVF
jgi:hypothetical protein